MALPKVHLTEAGERIPMASVASTCTAEQAHSTRWLLEFKSLVACQGVCICTLRRDERGLPKTLIGSIMLVLERPCIARSNVGNSGTWVHRKQILGQCRQGDFSVQLKQDQRVDVHVHQQVRLESTCTTELGLCVCVLCHVMQSTP